MIRKTSEWTEIFYVVIRLTRVMSRSSGNSLCDSYRLCVKIEGVIKEYSYSSAICPSPEITVLTISLIPHR
jgi:hypothetical protein